ncbi:MAG: hypothetical protein ACLTV1_14030 [Christensenellales bacterium]|jgi:hypothetical protein
MSVPNQKVVYIHKRKYTGNFLQIGIDEMRLAQQQMTYCEFVLYLYLAGNANGFKLELSQQAFENTTGYKKTAYHNAVNKLIELGYLTQSYNYHYEFHTTPVRSSKLNFEVLSNGKSMPPEKTKKSVLSNSQFRSGNREIDKTDNINKKDKESFFEKESESNGPSVDELLKELNLKCETVDGVMPLYELYPGWYDKPEEDVDVY